MIYFNTFHQAFPKIVLEKPTPINDDTLGKPATHADIEALYQALKTLPDVIKKDEEEKALSDFLANIFKISSL